ncbi:MAG: CAP domain-containing protein [Algoriphagus sp.]|uniref:CAP domain-containing protein n=1 Tax=Algoriphagus sp. TaxID=1872435 RepID=UPI00260F9F5C|nr:CAP domain-containing protein [Algoriphagus sp.]MDG1276460.1 CAP domain-containing protein [Algoriphagus sp.]
MKLSFLTLAIFCFLSFTLSAQQNVRIKNQWTNKYLNTENRSLQVSDILEGWVSAQWEFVNAGNNQYRIKNAWDGTYLNIESGILRSSQIENGWQSALWTLNKIEGSNSYRIGNVWKPTLYLNMENGLNCTTIAEGWVSAMWEISNVSGGSAQARSPQPSASTQGNTNSIFNQQKVLDAHNSLRREVGVPPLVWSSELEAKAKSWANKLALKNQGNDWVLEHSGSGENLAGGFVSGDSPDLRVLNGWGGEKADFDMRTRKCIPNKVCGHYTQIVWRNTTKVGCAVAVNPNGKYILVCNYDPPGNYNGEPAF